MTMIRDVSGLVQRGGEYGAVKPLCNAPHPDFPNWGCGRERDHPADWHVIFLFGGPVQWPVDNACNGD